MSCVDLHVHLLPGVDDGPSTFDETVAMLRVAWASGTRTVVATPHLYQPRYAELSPARIREVFDETVERLRELADREETAFLAEMELHLGAEHHLGRRFLNDLTNGRMMPLGESRYLLVELPVHLPLPAMVSAATRILAAGYVPLLAHVERYETVRRDSPGLAELLDLGCVAQLNLAHRSPSRREKKLRRTLLARGLVQVIASDAHDPETRPPRLGEAGALLEDGFSDDDLDAWTRGNPCDILDDKPLRRGWIRS